VIACADRGLALSRWNSLMTECVMPSAFVWVGGGKTNG
jgi:hypothetical protein